MGILKRTPHYRGLTLHTRTAGFFAAASLASLFVCSVVSPQSDPSEYQVKAAFLFNFTKFVEWPDGSFDAPQAPIVVGIIGDDPFGNDLERMIAGQNAPACCWTPRQKVSTASI
jgi:hypothetical protein